MAVKMNKKEKIYRINNRGLKGGKYNRLPEAVISTSRGEELPIWIAMLESDPDKGWGIYKDEPIQILELEVPRNLEVYINTEPLDKNAFNKIRKISLEELEVYYPRELGVSLKPSTRAVGNPIGEILEIGLPKSSFREEWIKKEITLPYETCLDLKNTIKELSLEFIKELNKGRDYVKLEKDGLILEGYSDLDEDGYPITNLLGHKWTRQNIG